MGRPKRDELDGTPLGLDRNVEMWADVQRNMHDIMNDWRAYDGPPNVLRHIGRLDRSTTVAWELVTGFDPNLIPMSTRREDAEDTDAHVIYRESIRPLLGWGDGTVSLVSATLGGGVTTLDRAVGLDDYSGRNSRWVADFEYFPCLHLGIVDPACNGPTGNALERTVDALKSSYELVPNPAGKVASDDAGTAERDAFYIDASGPIAVAVENASGSRTAPVAGGPLNQIRSDLQEIGYWATLTGAVVSVPTDREYTIEVVPSGSPSVVRMSRITSVPGQSTDVFFEDQTISDGGMVRFESAAGGSPLDAGLDVDADGDGTFESSILPAATVTSDRPGPSIPQPTPVRISEVVATFDADPAISLEIPEPEGATWSWTLEGVPDWITADKNSGEAPSTIDLGLLASTLGPGIHRDTLTVALTLDAYTVRIGIPVELAIRDLVVVLASIDVHPASVDLFFGDSLRFLASGKDQLGLPIDLDPVWSATGGTIDQRGVFVAGSTAGQFEVVASEAGGLVTGRAAVNILGAVSNEDEALPASFALAQNYPNPFNPSTIIQFDLPTSEHVELVVFDLAGREVDRLVDGSRPAGRHRVLFDSRDLPSGIYLYRLRAGSFVTTMRMLLLR
jgi:hypothetical protein